MRKAVRGPIIHLLFVAGLLAPDAVRADQQTDSLVAAYNRSGLELFAQLAKEPGNVIVSPLGIGTAMAMAFSGARGGTLGEMAAVLGHSQSRDAVADANRRLRTLVSSRAENEDATITVANALHVTGSGNKVASDYQGVLKDSFAARIFTGSDVAAINAWVRQETAGRIDSLLARLDPNSVCVVLNAVHFKGGWASAFEEKNTGTADFRLSGRETVSVPTMRQTGRFRLAATDAFEVISLPYRGERLDMIILLPRHPPEAGQAPAFDRDSLSKAIAALDRARLENVKLSLPKFKTEFEADLVPPFKSLGLVGAFDRDRADFSGITGSTEEVDRIHITQIRHKAHIDVDEAGTEAAAATAVEFATRSVATAPKAFSVDRPFYYVVAERISGAFLFMGRVSDPRT